MILKITSRFYVHRESFKKYNQSYDFFFIPNLQNVDTDMDKQSKVRQ